MNNSSACGLVCLVVVVRAFLCASAAMTNADLEGILRDNAPTNCTASGCAIAYRVADGQKIAEAKMGEMSPDYAYEPGSVVKPLTAVAAMEHKVAQLDTPYPTNRDDPKYYKLPGDGAHVWPERMSVADALVRSSNIVFGKLGADVGTTNLLATYSAFGIESRGGRLPHLDRIDRATVARLPIGQGLLATPDEIARAYAVLANHGKSPWTGKQVVAEKTADEVANVLRRVVAKEGTGRRAAVEGIAVAGKTGTAQRIIDSKYVRLYNSTFAGFFPAEKPEYVVAVVYQTNPDGDRLYQGGGHSALAFSQIASAMSEKRGSGKTLHVEDIRTNEVSVVDGGKYKAFFDVEIDLPNFRHMPAPVVAQFVELVTGQPTNVIQAAVRQERADFFAACQREEGADGERFLYETTAKLMHQDRRFVSYRINYCHWAGCPCGAANEGETTNVTFDCKLEKRLCADDIVSRANRRKLLNVIRRQLWQQSRNRGWEFERYSEPETRTDAEVAAAVANAGKGDIGTVWVSDNFCLTPEGIEWTFMPCEIASASHGTITVKVPWRELAGIVADEFRPR